VNPRSHRVTATRRNQVDIPPSIKKGGFYSMPIIKFHWAIPTAPHSGSIIGSGFLNQSKIS
jgi:hypothetical protein